MNENGKYWQNKKAKIEILKDNRRLIYTAHDIMISDGLISFVDRDGNRFSFSTAMVVEMQEIKGNGGF